jgi:hypothetical protein
MSRRMGVAVVFPASCFLQLPPGVPIWPREKVTKKAAV